MKNLLNLAVVVMMFATMTVFAANKEVKIKANMHCETCKGKIENGLKKTSGIISSSADLASNIVTIKYDDAKTNPDKIKTAVADLGYKADLYSKDNKECDASKKECCKTGAKCDDKAKTASKKACCDTKATKSK